MKKYLLTVCALALFVSFAAKSAHAQSGTVASGPDSSVLKDIEAEKSAMHELKVARHYFHNKKAYYASFKRADELIAGYPEFSKLDEALYIAAMSSIFLSEGKGKQQAPKSPPEKAQEFSPEALRSNAREYLSRIVKNYPQSDFLKEAEAALSQLDGGAQTKEEKKQ
jgi:outer membrane protein assembly factor BamD (BamD/ComL family)